MIVSDPRLLLMAAAKNRAPSCIEYPDDFGSPLITVEGSQSSKIIIASSYILGADIGNTDNGVFYYRTERQTGFSPRNKIFLYKNAAKTQLVAAASTSGTGLLCIPSGGSGIFALIAINSNLATANTPDQKITVGPAKSLQGPWTFNNDDQIAIDLGNFQVTGARTKWANDQGNGLWKMWWVVQIGGGYANRLRLHAASFRQSSPQPSGTWDLVALSAVMPRPLPAPATIPLVAVGGSGINASFDVETFVGNAASIGNTVQSPICGQ